jgi:hypothetical protein
MENMYIPFDRIMLCIEVDTIASLPELKANHILSQLDEVL